MDPQLPPRLGLIRSTNAAQTWQSVSLSGSTDFHALQAAHGRVYGWDSGSSELMVSVDAGRTWDTRSTLMLPGAVASGLAGGTVSTSTRTSTPARRS